MKFDTNGLFDPPPKKNMKTETEEMMEQIEEMIAPALAMAQGLYKKMAADTNLWRELAKCHKTAIDAFVAEGFSREEAISMTIASLNNLGIKK